jgi:hypothetical protein
MTAVWITVAALFVGSAAIKASGPLALGGRQPPARALAVIALVAPAVLAGLVVYETFNTSGPGIEVDARVVGLAAAGLAAAARMPMLLIVVIAATATALVRAVG